MSTDARAIDVNATSAIPPSPKPEIREQTQASPPPTPDEDGSYEGDGQLIARIDERIKNKLDVLDNRVGDVNHNMDMLKKKFDLLSVNENYVNQKLFNFEASMNEKLEKLENAVKHKIDNLEEKMRQKLDNLRNGIENSVTDPWSSNESLSAIDASEARLNQTTKDRKKSYSAVSAWFNQITATLEKRVKNFWKYLYEL